MQRPTKIALLAAGLGLATVGAVATTTVRAASTSADTTTATTTAAMPAPPSGGHGEQHLADLAKLFSMSTSDLQTALQSGKELYQIAAEHGVTYDQVKANAESQYKTKLDDMVKVGYLTQSEADTFLKNWQTTAASSPMLEPGLGGGHGPMMGR